VLLGGRVAVICRGVSPSRTAGVVGHVESVGDALEDVGVADARMPLMTSLIRPLAEADCSADARSG